MRAPAILLLLAVFGLAGCGATKWATYGGKNPSGVIIGVPLDIVTAPSQIADAVRRGEAQRRQEVLTNKLNASPVIVLDPKVAAVPEDRSTLLRWFDAAPSAARDACQEWLCGVDPVGYRDAYRVFAAQDGPSGQALENLRCPALFLTGEDEPNSTPQMSQRMAALAPKGKSIVLKKAAHMLPMTHATQVTEILETFIRDTQIDTN